MVSRISHNSRAHFFDPIATFPYKTPPTHRIFQSFCQYNWKLNNLGHQSFLGFALRRESMASISVPCPKTVLVAAGAGSNAQNSLPNHRISFPRPPNSIQNSSLSFGSIVSGFEVSSFFSNLVIFSISSSFGCSL